MFPMEANRRDDLALVDPVPCLPLSHSDTHKKTHLLLRKDYLEIQYANVRIPVDPSIVERNCVPFKVGLKATGRKKERGGLLSPRHSGNPCRLCPSFCPLPSALTPPPLPSPPPSRPPPQKTGHPPPGQTRHLLRDLRLADGEDADDGRRRGARLRLPRAGAGRLVLGPAPQERRAPRLGQLDPRGAQAAGGRGRAAAGDFRGCHRASCEAMGRVDGGVWPLRPSV